MKYNYNTIISIITISYNNENDIRETIESVINQSYKNIEYIIIDGGSRDKTVDIINEYKEKIGLIISEKDEGMYDAINKGMKLANGYIVGLIHAGDKLYDNDVIMDINQAFTSYDIDAVYGNSVIVNSNNKPIRVNISPEFSKSLFKRGWMPSHQSVYIKKEFINQLGHYRLDLGGSADYEFILRYFYFNNLRIKKIDRYIVRFSLGGRSTSQYKKLFKSQMIQKKCWQLNGENPPSYWLFLKLLRKIPQFIRASKLN